MIDERLPFLKRLRVELSDPLRYRLALRTAIACLVVEIATALLHLTHVSWALFSAFVIIQLSRGATVQKAMMLIAGTAAGCAVGFLVTCSLLGHSIIMVWLFSVWAICAMYAGRRGLYPYAFLLATLTPFIVGFSGTVSYGQIASVAAARFVDIAVGVVIACGVVVLVWPIDEVSHVLSNTGGTVKRVLRFSIAVSTWRSKDLARIGWEARKSLARQDFLLKNIEFGETHGHEKQQVQALQTPLRSLLGHALYIHGILRRDPSIERPVVMSPFLDGLASFVEELLRIPDAKVLDYLAGCSKAIGRLCADLERERHSLLKNHVSSDHPACVSPERTVLLFYLTETLSELVEIATKKRPAKTSASVGPGKSLTEKLFPNGRIDRTSLKDAVKIVTSVLIASVVWTIPTGNAQATVSAALVANQGRQVASYKKLAFRLLGTLLGGAIGFGYAAAVQSTHLALLGLSACVLLLCSYVGLGDEDWSYAGYSTGVCFILCIGTAGGELNAFHAAAGRMKGIVLGGMTGAMAAKFLFPFDYRKKIHELREYLVVLYARGIALIGQACATNHAATEETWELLMEMRKSTMECESVIHDAVWDRLEHLRKRSAMMADADRVRLLYRHFFSAFAVSKRLESCPVEPEIADKVRSILAVTSSVLKEKGVPPESIDGTFFAAELDKTKQMIGDTLDVIAREARDDEPGAEEGLFYVGILLHYLNDIIGELHHI